MRLIPGAKRRLTEQALFRCHAYNFHISHNKQVFLPFLYLENSERTPESETSRPERYRIDNDDELEDDNFWSDAKRRTLNASEVDSRLALRGRSRLLGILQRTDSHFLA